MTKFIKIFTLLFWMFVYANITVSAYELDLSVDEEIKKKYNTSQINYDLPALPKVTNTTSTTSSKSNTSTNSSVPKITPVYNQAAPAITAVDKTNSLKIAKWTKFQTKSNQIISDSMPAGTIISFTTTETVYKKNITIPAGTKLTGQIVSSHRPQVTGNGGSVVLKITSLTYNGKAYNANGKVTKANTKNIFFNNIKGEHQYIEGVKKQVDKGENFYGKTQTLSNQMSSNSILVILSPVPTVVGAVGCAVCTILSPLTALSAKGGNLSIPSGSIFEIKLLDDAFVNK